MKETTPKLDKYGINAIARHVIGAVLTAVMLFLGAGTLDWGAAWVFGILNLLGWTGLSVALVRYNPELLNVRGKPTRQNMQVARRWDTVILALYAGLLILQPLVAGIDYRSGWSAPVSPVVMGLGNALNLTGLAMLTWSMVANRFFAPTVHIQGERGHQAVDAGPYRYLRHPGYVGVILQFVGLALAVGSWAALVLGVVGAILFVVRTALEDRTLQAELPGYAEYAQRTHYRLLPGVW